MEIKVAILGLGRVGTAFLGEALKYQDKGIHVVAVGEMTETEGKKMAEDAGVPVKSDTEIVQMGDNVDIIFDLTGNTKARRKIRELLSFTNNGHTVIAPESIAYMVWTIATGEPITEFHEHKGY